MHQDNDLSLASTKVARFASLGRSIKLIAGAVVVMMTWLSIGLGFVAFGLFLYLHLLLRRTHRVADVSEAGAVIAPLDGQVIAVRRGASGLTIIMAGDLSASQLIYAPISASIEDKLWIDGAYLPFEDVESHPLSARYEFLLETQEGKMISLSVFGGSWTRYIHAPFSDGQHVNQGEPFAFGLMQSLVTVHLPATYQALVGEGTHIIAQQSCIAKLG